MKYFWLIIILTWAYKIQCQKPDWVELAIDLPQKVSHIELDTFGFVWMCSQNSMHRYNGNRLQSIKEFREGKITSITKHDGRFYMGTSLGYLLDFDPLTKSHKVKYQSRDSLPITSLHIIDDSNYVLLSYGKGMVLNVNGKSHFLNTDNGLLSNEMYDVTFLDNKYFIASDQEIMVVALSGEDFRLSQIKISDGLSDQLITHLCSVGEGLWYSDYNKNIGFISIEGHIDNYPLPTKSQITDLVIDDQSVVISTVDGIWKLENKEWKSYELPGLIQNTVLLTIDDQRNLYCLDNQNNIYKSSLAILKQPHHLDNVKCLALMNDQILLGNGKGLFVSQGDRFRKVFDFDVTSILYDGNHIIVGSFANGIVVLDKDFRVIDRLDNWAGVENESVLDVYEVEGIIYISSLSGVMRFTMENGRLIKKGTLNDIVGQNYIYSMEEEDGRMYFGTDRNGVLMWNMKNNAVKEIVHIDNGDNIGSVYAFTKGQDGTIWATSSTKGIVKIDEKTVSSFFLPISTIDDYTSICMSKQGILHLVNSSSIDIIDPLPTDKGRSSYNVGLKDEVQFLNTIICDETRVVLAHDQYLYHVNYTKDMFYQPKAILDEILINLVAVGDRRVFRQDENNVEFRFSAFTHSEPSKLTFQYKLEGLDSEWRTTMDNVVVYPKLNPGQYVFLVRASESEHSDLYPESSFSFVIKKHWYLLWWVRLLSGVLVLLIGYYWIKAYQNRERQKLQLEKLTIENQLSNLKTQLNPHFLFNSFNTLISLIEEDGERGVRFAEKLTDFYRDMLHFGEESTISLKQEYHILTNYLSILRERFGDNIIIDEKVESSEDYEIPPFTLQLLVENAVKHNVASTSHPLKVYIHQAGSELKITNYKIPLVSKVKSTKLGLQNIIKRFGLAGFQVPQVIETEDVFTVVLNLRKK